MNTMRLANCLALDGDLASSLELLNKVVYFDRSEKPEDYWIWNVFGLALLSELASFDGNDGLKGYYAALRSYTWLPKDSLAYARKVLGNHSGTMGLLNHLVDDDIGEIYSICEEICDEVLELRYFYQYLFMARKPSLIVKIRLRGIREAKEAGSVELVKKMNVVVSS